MPPSWSATSRSRSCASSSSRALADGAARDALFEGAPARRAARSDSRRTDGARADTFAVLHGLYWLTAALAEQQPLLLAIDDAHWADAASLDFLGFLLPRLEELPVLLVLACRPDEAGAESSLARIATDVQARRLTPRALSRGAAGALLAGELEHEPEEAFATTCHEVSGGNPFLLHELARTVAHRRSSPSAEQAPSGARAGARARHPHGRVRIARLPPERAPLRARWLVLGEDADPQLVAELAGLDADACGPAPTAARAAILDAEAARCASSIRSCAPRSTRTRRRRARRRARACGHAAAGPGRDPEQVAAHLVASDGRGNARPWRRCSRRRRGRSDAAPAARRSPT